MDENEFRRLLDLFPVVRSRDFVLKEWHDAWDHGDNKQVAIEGLYQHDAFWTKLKTAAERKITVVFIEFILGYLLMVSDTTQCMEETSMGTMWRDLTIGAQLYRWVQQKQRDFARPFSEYIKSLNVLHNALGLSRSSETELIHKI
ncbi:hypothetical protein L484_013552 [Morus notabilis]|uniref:Uncharacterized protein n=1 Tax=Morus notabilis TaxID=981085 RepID=W9QPA0_9ROSA|nr:hypothetical protein L484_013552 [Morus notabilis]